MYGSSVGKLSVFAIAGAQNTQLVAYNGNQGNTWHLVQAAFSATQNYQVNTLILPQMVNKRYFNYHLKTSLAVKALSQLSHIDIR